MLLSGNHLLSVWLSTKDNKQDVAPFAIYMFKGERLLTVMELSERQLHHRDGVTALES